MPPLSRGSSAGAAASFGARSVGGVAGGVTGSRLQPVHGPASDAASNVASDKRIVAGGLVARRRPRPDIEHERLLELAHRSSLAQSFVVGVDAASRGTFAKPFVTVFVGIDVVVHCTHRAPPPGANEQATCQLIGLGGRPLRNPRRAARCAFLVEVRETARRTRHRAAHSRHPACWHVACTFTPRGTGAYLPCLSRRIIASRIGRASRSCP